MPFLLELNRLWHNLSHGSDTTRLGADDLLMLGSGEGHSGEIIVWASKIVSVLKYLST